jgi:hypothetical protein
MNLLETLLHPELLVTLGLFSVISIAMEVVGYTLLKAIPEVEMTSWLAIT